MSILDNNTTPKLNIGGLASNGALPKTGVLSSYSLPNQTQTQNSGLVSSGQNIQSSIPQGTNTGLLNQPKPDTTYTATTTTNGKGGTSTKPTPNKSVLAQQQALNQANKNTAGYVPLVEDGLAGPKTQAAVEKYGYNTQTGQPNTPKTANTSSSTSSPTTYTPENLGVNGVSQGGLIGNAVAQSQAPSPEYVKQQEEANRIAGERTALAQDFAQKTNNIAGTAGFLTQQSGLQGLLQNQYNAGQSALSSQEASATSRLGAANTAQQLQQSALSNALGANAPIQQSYSNMLINPATGQPYSQSGGNLQDTVKSVVQKLNSGQMTYNDALNALSGYGQGGVNELQKQLPPGFNIAQSNTLSGQQGTVKINYELADKALSNVETLMKQLMGLQQSNIPFVAKGANWLSTQFGVGSEQTRAVTGAVQSLRNAYASLLASAKGGTPTDYSGQAVAEIPDQPTPNDIAAVRKNFETLGKVRKDILGNPGVSGTSGSSTGGGTIQTNYGNINPNL